MRQYPSDIRREEYEEIREDLEGARKKTRPREYDLYDVFCAVLYVVQVEYNGECCPAIIQMAKRFTISGYGPKKMKRASVFWIRCCTNWSSRYGMKT